MNHVNTNRINNFIYRYCIKDTKENFNKIGEVITQKRVLCLSENLIYD